MSPGVTVRFTGELRALAGQSSLQLSLKDGATLADALAAMAEMVPPAFTNQTIEPLLAGNPAAPLLLLNGALCSGQALHQPLAEGNILAFVLPMEGG